MNKKYIKKFGKHLKKLRKERGLTQEDLEIADEISRSTISMVEIGANDITLSKINQ
jgi:transcriptional regulator with XRE-family HTH domain